MTSTSVLEEVYGLLAAMLAGTHSATEAVQDLPALRFPGLPPEPLGAAIPRDAQQRHWKQFLTELDFPAGAPLLDFGCGAADRREQVEAAGFTWWGLDVPHSLESEARASNDRVTLYDGHEVPLPSGRFSVVLSAQSFEHVADPHLSIRETARILRPGGILLGSTSHLEPYHSRSTFSYSAYGFATLLAAHGLRPVTIAPAIDGFTLLARRLMQGFRAVEDVERCKPYFSAVSPLHQLIEAAGERQNIAPERRNALKLEVTGQFHFLARKEEPPPRAAARAVTAARARGRRGLRAVRGTAARGAAGIRRRRGT